MPDTLLSAAESALGPGALPSGQRYFTETAFAEGADTAERYRHAMNLLQDRRQLMEMGASMARAQLTTIESVKIQEAMRDEASALNRLKALDPLAPDFEDQAISFAPLAAYSKAVSRALDIKTGQKNDYSNALGTLASEMGAVDLGEEQVGTTLSTAADMLRNRRYNDFRVLTSRVLGMVEGKKRRMQLDAMAASDAEREEQAAMSTFEKARASLVESFPGLQERFPDFFAGPGATSSDAVKQVQRELAVQTAMAAGNSALTSLGSAVSPEGEVLSEEVLDRLIADARSGSEDDLVSKWLPRSDGMDADPLAAQTTTADKDLLKSFHRKIRDLYAYHGAANKVTRMRAPAEGTQKESGSALQALLEVAKRQGKI